MFQKVLPIILGASLILTLPASLSAVGINVFSEIERGKCAPPGTPREALNRAHAVFIGTITEISEKDNLKTIKFSVERYWKGANVKTQTVLISTGMRYGPSFQKGERYIVYAAKNQNGDLTTGRCTRTKLAEYADDDLKELGSGKKP